jgi:hypothetical protein
MCLHVRLPTRLNMGRFIKPVSGPHADVRRTWQLIVISPGATFVDEANIGSSRCPAQILPRDA